MGDEQQPLAQSGVNSMQGKVVLVTGANTGIGRETSLALAQDGAHVVMACRSEARAKEAMDYIKEQVAEAELTFLRLDLASLASVRRAAEAFVALKLPLHVLVNNAGLAGKGLTEDGFEIAFGVNHVGHFLLVKLLMPLLEQTTAPRVVLVASMAHYSVKKLVWEDMRKTTVTTTGLREYEVSKLCNVLHGKALAKRYPGVLVSSLHPGVVASDVWRNVPCCLRQCIKLFMISNTDGAKTSLHCIRNELTASGLYYDKQKPKTPSKFALSEDLANELWDKSEEWVKDFAEAIV